MRASCDASLVVTVTSVPPSPFDELGGPSDPELHALTKDTNNYWEGCLSVPGLRGLVARPNKVKVKYLDRNGKPSELVAEGFLATVLQHEFDHLEGKLYVDNLVDPTKLVFEQESEKYWLPNAGDEDLDD